MVQMADILVLCPKTGREVSTGLKTEWVMFETLPGIQMPLTCPACDGTHNWRPKDAWISNRNGAAETVTPEKAGHEIERLRSDNRDLARMLAAARQQLEKKLKAEDSGSIAGLSTNLARRRVHCRRSLQRSHPAGDDQ
jgi:hypothetical protein